MMIQPRPRSLRWLRGSVPLLAIALFARAVPVLPAEPAAPTGAPAAAAPHTREYLHHQPPDTTLVFRFESFESEFESRLFDADGTLFKVSGVPGLRLGPVFQFVEAVASERQLRIEATLGRRSSRAKIEMQLVRFDNTGPDQDLQQKAYRLLSHGLEAAPPDRLDLWQLKVMSLKQAAMLFDSLGMQEPMLWAEFYAGHFLLERLADALSAAESGRLLQTAALRARQHTILLAGLQLEGRALLALASAGGGSATYDRAREVLEQAAAQAAEMDYRHERALALYLIGLAFEREGRHEDAFTHYERALEVTARAGDVDLANALRRHAAGLHERLGDTDAAIAMMQRIDTDRAAATAAAGTESGGDDTPDAHRSQRQTARYLYEQGRLLEKAYRHAEAVDVLRQALALERDTPGSTLRGAIGMLLGKALFHAGRLDEAAQQLVEAIPRTLATTDAEALREGWGILAAIRRSRGDFDALAVAREQQSRFIVTPLHEADLAYQRGLDALAGAGGDTAAARRHFDDALRGARASGLDNLARLARLNLCALPGPADDDCSAELLLRELASLQASAPPAEVFEGRWLQVRSLEQQGRHAQAAAVIEDLLEEMLFYQARLPGILGAWYWLQRDAIFDRFVELQLRPGPAGRRPALRTLAALDALRAPAPAGAAGAENSITADADRLRSLLAAREDAAATPPPAGENAEIAALLRQLGARTGRAELAGLAARLGKRLEGLTPAESLLAYHVSGSRAYAWTGNRDGIRLTPLRWDAGRTTELARDIEGLRWDAAAGARARTIATLDRLGESLLGPVDGLGEVIHFLPTGRLEGLPLDALRHNGRYLAASHRVINLLALAGLENAAPAAVLAPETRLFLAGNRQEGAGDFGLVTPPSAEIQAVAERFIGPGLTLRQGAALQWDEFQDARFAAAGLLHLAMPCVEDLRDPAGAHLLMSDNADDPDHELLRGFEIPGPLQARLAVLSNCEFVGSNGSPLGWGSTLVGTTLAAGAAAVVASLWRVGDEPAAEFMRRFYARLSAQPDIGRALAETKRSFLAEGNADPALAWAAFQLFID